MNDLPRAAANNKIRLCRRGRALASLFVALTAGALAQSNADALHKASREGDLAAVKKLIEAGVPVDAPTDYGATALTYAAGRSRPGDLPGGGDEL